MGLIFLGLIKGKMTYQSFSHNPLHWQVPLGPRRLKPWRWMSRTIHARRELRLSWKEMVLTSETEAMYTDTSMKPSVPPCGSVGSGVWGAAETPDQGKGTKESAGGRVRRNRGRETVGHTMAYSNGFCTGRGWAAALPSHLKFVRLWGKIHSGYFSMGYLVLGGSGFSLLLIEEA